MAFQAQHKGKHPVKDNRRMKGDKVAKGKPWKESSKGSFHLAAIVKEPIIKKKTVGSKKSHPFSVDSVERWVIVRKIPGSSRINHNSIMRSR